MHGDMYNRMTMTISSQLESVPESAFMRKFNMVTAVSAPTDSGSTPDSTPDAIERSCVCEPPVEIILQQMILTPAVVPALQSSATS